MWYDVWGNHAKKIKEMQFDNPANILVNKLSQQKQTENKHSKVSNVHSIANFSTF
jgi:hypothetical protein